MQIEPQSIHQHRARLLVGVLVVILGSVVLGALIAPHVFNLLLGMGRQVPSWEGLRDSEFHRVASRCVMLSAVLVGWPVLRWAGFTSWPVVGLARRVKGWSVVGRWWLIGVASMLLVCLAGWVLGAYSLAPGSGGHLVGWVFSFTLTGLAVGFFEELFCRGVVHGALRKTMKFTFAAILASVFYSFLHFAKPEPPYEAVYAHAGSGFELFGHAFSKLSWAPDVFPFVLTLVMIGMVFSLLYERQGHIYGAIGLHAGWVMVILLSQQMFVREAGVLPFWFGTESLVSTTYAALLMSTCVLVYLLFKLPRTVSDL